MRFLLILIMIAWGPAYGRSILPRDLAQKDIETDLAGARNYIGKSPEALGTYLLDTLAIPVGDDPRVLDLCHEILTTSPKQEDFWLATQALGYISSDHLRFFGRAKQKAAIADNLRIALDKGDGKTKSHAFRIMILLGGTYRDEAYKRQISLLDSDRTPSSDDEREVLVNSIRVLIEADRKDAVPVIRKATKSYGLLPYYERQVESEPNKWIKERGEIFLARWRKLVEME